MTPNTEIPQTLLRSAPQAQQLWKKAHGAAIKANANLSQAHRLAFSALKSEFEKDGDRWIPKNTKKASATPVATSSAKTKTAAAKTAKPVAKPKIGTTSAPTRRRRRKTVNSNNKKATARRVARGRK